jgi:diguanylate cyclase
MDYRHSFEQSAEYCQRASALMQQNRIAPTPNNFAVWYAYASGESPPLTKLLDVLMTSGQEFTDERNAEIFVQYRTHTEEALPLHRIADRIEAELGVVLNLLESAGRNVYEYSGMLEKTTADVENVQHAEGLRQIIGRVVGHTRTMAMRSREVERKLYESACEVGALKSELEGARREAVTDPLTGLGNRKMFESIMRQRAVHAMENGEPLSLMMIDIDHFKRFNDDFGHVVGDQVLRLLSVVLQENIKGQDTAIRFGGEEFAIVLPQTASCDARKLADNIRTKVGAKKLINRKTGETLRQMTVSIGVAEFHFGEPISKLLERADRALYFAKRMGRNRVIADEDVHGPALLES